MITTKLTLSDYLALGEVYEGRREFVDGDIIEMPTESPQNLLISLFLLAQFLQLVPFQQLRRMDTELVVARRVRIPDLMVLGEDLAAVLLASGRSTITEEMPAPLLAVEVVSPGKANEDRDYRFKRSEYAARGIPEYWIVDPARAMVTVLMLVDGLYEVVEYGGGDSLQDDKGDRVVSALFPQLNLTVEQVLQAGSNP